MKQEKKRNPFQPGRAWSRSHGLLNRANWRTRCGGLLHKASDVVDWPVCVRTLVLLHVLSYLAFCFHLQLLIGFSLLITRVWIIVFCLSPSLDHRLYERDKLVIKMTMCNCFWAYLCMISLTLGLIKNEFPRSEEGMRMIANTLFLGCWILKRKNASTL